MSGWLPGFVKSEPVSGTPGTVGAVANVHFNENGTETVIKETVTSLVPNEKLGMTFSVEDFMDMEYEISTREVDGKTTMTSKTTTVGNGLISKSIVALMKGTMQTQEDTNMAALKKLIEENTTDYFPVAVDSTAVIVE